MVFPGGFVCAKNALIALNAFYIFVAIILIISGAYAKAASIIPTLSIAGSIIAPGVCLLLVAVLGAFGGVKRHQVALFFYMIVLFVVFLVQFFVAIACLAISDQHIKRGLENGWQIASNETKCFAERSFDCCHFGEYKSPICRTVVFDLPGVCALHMDDQGTPSNISGVLSVVEKPHGIYIEWSAFETASPSKTADDTNDWVLADSSAAQSKSNENSSSNLYNNRMKINLDLKDLRSFELLNENSDTDGSVKFYAKDGTTHAPLHFTMGGCSDFINTLQKYLSLKRSRKEANLILVCHENAAAYEQSVKVLWKDNSRDFLSRIFADPYGAAYTGLSKLSDFVQDRVSLLPGFLNIDDLDPEQQKNTIQSLLELKKREEESDASDLLRTHPSTDGFEVVQYALPQRPKISREDPLTFDHWKSHVNDDGSINNVSQLKSKIFHGGMDPEIRQQVWPLLLGVYCWDSTNEQRQQQKSENQNYYYRMKLQWKTMSEDQQSRYAEFRDRMGLIEKDVARTDRTHKFFEGEQNQNLSTLRDILMTYVMYNFDLGYVQGMSDLLSPIMVVMDNEVDSFWAFVGFMNKIHKNFEMDQKTIKRQLMQMRDLLYVINPSFHNYLETHESDNMYFCFRWILVLFKREFNFTDIMRLWEVLWTGLPCENFHLLICAAVLDQQKDLIVENKFGFTEILKHVNDLSMRLNLSQLLTSAEAIYHQLSACQHHLPDYVCKHLGFDVEPHTVQNLHKKLDFWAQEAKPPAGGAAPGTVVRRMEGQSDKK